MTAFRLFPEDVAKLALIADVLHLTKTDAFRLMLHQFDISPKGIARATENRMTSRLAGIPERIGDVTLSQMSVSRAEIAEIREACGFTGAAPAVKHKKNGISNSSSNSDSSSLTDLGDFSLEL